VKLLDPASGHIWKPRLHEIAIGLLVASEEQASYAEQAAVRGFTFVLGAVKSIDTTAVTALVGAVR
jgi:NADH:ubiquinone reductase (H+-translocating)